MSIKILKVEKNTSHLGIGYPKESGSYIVQAISWTPPDHLPQNGIYPKICDPSTVEVIVTTSGKVNIYDPFYRVYKRIREVNDYIWIRKIETNTKEIYLDKDDEDYKTLLFLKG